jgi:protein SCO1/2
MRSISTDNKPLLKTRYRNPGARCAVDFKLLLRFFTFCLSCAIFTGCATSPEPQGDKSSKNMLMDKFVYSEGLASTQGTAGHISRPDRPNIYTLPRPKPLKDFQLTDDKGQPFNRTRLIKKWTFMYYGYTNCPDVCPMTTSLLDTVYESLGQRPDIQANTQVIFISVDPVRDTPQTLHSYITYFNKAFAAAIGSEKQLDELTLQMDARHQILYSEHLVTHEKKIRVMHDSAIYLIDPQARLYAVFTPPHSPELVRNRYVSIREAFQSINKQYRGTTK